jgi:hypothetical protein
MQLNWKLEMAEKKLKKKEMSCSTIITSRFNQQTWNENALFREKHGISGCIYGSPRPVSEKIPLRSLMFVVEMNNSTNKIEGIGLVRNWVCHDDQKCRVYQVGNYNRYVYLGQYRLGRESLNVDIVTILETLVFKGKTHLKRGRGMTRINKKMYEIHHIFQKYGLTESQIRLELSSSFKRAFVIPPLDLDSGNANEEEQEEIREERIIK